MDFVGGLPKSKKNHDYLYVVVERFSKMCILMPCKKQVTTEKMAQMFFQHVWVHFGLPKSIISDRDSRFIGNFWSSLWALMDTKLKKSIAFHPQTNGQTEVVNRTVVHLLRGYFSKHPKLWDEHLHYIQHRLKVDFWRSKRFPMGRCDPGDQILLKIKSDQNLFKSNRCIGLVITNPTQLEWVQTDVG
jgi:hypothetical protein